MLEVDTGVTSDTAASLCAQYGAELVTDQWLSSHHDLRHMVTQRSNTCAADHGTGYWLRPDFHPRLGSCPAWIPDYGLLTNVPYSVTRLDCNVTNTARGNIKLQTLCHKQQQVKSH